MYKASLLNIKQYVDQVAIEIIILNEKKTSRCSKQQAVAHQPTIVITCVFIKHKYNQVTMCVLMYKSSSAYTVQSSMWCNYKQQLCTGQLPYMGKFWQGKILAGENIGEQANLNQLEGKILANKLYVYT